MIEDRTWVVSGFTAGTALVMSVRDGIPRVHWIGPTGPSATTALAQAIPGVGLLTGQASADYRSPAVSGFRLGDAIGADWSVDLRVESIERGGQSTVLHARDDSTGLSLDTTIEALLGGALRIRHQLTNTAATPYVLERLQVHLPLPFAHTEVQTYAGREQWERAPQRVAIEDGTFVRENRRGRPGHENATAFITGAPGFGYTHGSVLGTHLAWSGNSSYAIERDSTGAMINIGELLLPGEIVLQTGESYATPWVHLASGTGIDDVSAAFHSGLRAQAAHPSLQPVTLNVWEAVYFDHDLEQLRELADLAAAVGVERYVLDDGWFSGRRDDNAGLGDWWVDPQVWPDGLDPIARYVTDLGLEFGLWFEPEMVNPDSDLYRAHPDWILATGGREPRLQRHQLVLDLTRPEVGDYLFERMHAILSAYPISYVKWDHNRDLLDAGSGTRGGAAAVHRQTLAYYALLDRVREAHPEVAIESCAAGGARIDLEVAGRVQRVWASDNTDALARQHIQRAAVTLIAPEYLGAHVSSPMAHQTYREFSLDFRAATAFFGAFGIEWNLQNATDHDLKTLTEWISLYKAWRPILHTGRVVRPDSDEPRVIFHGVIAADQTSAIIAHVQLDESDHNRGTVLRFPGLDPDRSYRLAWEGPVDWEPLQIYLPAPQPDGPIGQTTLTGRQLAEVGVWLGRRRPHTSTLITFVAVD